MLLTYELEEIHNKLSLFEKSRNVPPVTAFFCSIAAYWVNECLKFYKEGR